MLIISKRIRRNGESIAGNGEKTTSTVLPNSKYVGTGSIYALADSKSDSAPVFDDSDRDGIRRGDFVGLVCGPA
ncbi:MAG TPA: hypothetical protein DIW81_20280, partial [Planctomycetaceae bacterium]|nr:hypothetical protein [Planctomycetaceae bacterium]